MIGTSVSTPRHSRTDGQIRASYPCLPDPKDDHILELAVASEKAIIATHNVKHFKNATAFGVRVLTPSQLLEELR